jgi:hypothetical protein
MTWLYPAEITPLSIRAAGNGVSTAGNWIFNFVVVLITPIAFATIGHKTYIIFAVINFAMVIATYFIFPETAGRSLEVCVCACYPPRSVLKSLRKCLLSLRRPVSGIRTMSCALKEGHLVDTIDMED